jgi:hypothetical protein
LSTLKSSPPIAQVSTTPREWYGEHAHVEIVPDNHHRCVTARALALDLYDGEFTVLRGLAGLLEVQMADDGVKDFVRAAEHAWSGSADLYEVVTDGFTAA